MASRMIHYVVAKRILEKITIEDENAFCLGAIMPDCYNIVNECPKNISHFSKVYNEENVRGCNFKDFYEKYLKNDMDSFCLGYFLHLLMDCIYLKDVQANTIMKYDKNNRQHIIYQGYQDMHRFNTILKEKYNLTYDLIPLESWKVNEIGIENQKPFLEEFQKDFNDLPVAEFVIHDIEMLERYMDKCVEIGIKNIHLILSHQACEDPKQYMCSNDYR